MPTQTSPSVPSRRAGMTLIEVIIAVVILSGVLIGLSNFTRRFQHLTNNHDALTVASELATARLEVVKMHRPYATISTTFNGSTETSTTSTADPPMSAYPGYSRTTAVASVDSSYKTRYVTVTVTVTHAATATSVSKSLVISAF